MSFKENHLPPLQMNSDLKKKKLYTIKNQLFMSKLTKVFTYPLQMFQYEISYYTCSTIRSYNFGCPQLIEVNEYFFLTEE